MAAAAQGVDPCLRGDSKGHSPKPARQRILDPEEAGLTSEHQESRLECIFGVMLIAQHAAAYTQDHRAVPLHQDLERGFGIVVLPGKELLDQLRVAHSAGSPQSVQPVDFANDAGVSICHHGLLRAQLSYVNARKQPPAHGISLRIRLHTLTTITFPASRQHVRGVWRLCPVP